MFVPAYFLFIVLLRIFKGKKVRKNRDERVAGNRQNIAPYNPAEKFS